MDRRYAIILAVSMIIAAFCLWAEDGKQLDDNSILSLVLTRSYDDGGFTVVASETALSHGNLNDPTEAKGTKGYLLKNIKIEGCDVSALIDRLIERNKKSVRLTLKSSPEKGYAVDYEGKYKRYFEKDGGGWEKWYKENPRAHGLTEVSLPVYDPKSDIVLVYVGTQGHWLAGSGFVIAYRYEDSKLVELCRVMMWIS